MNAHLPDWIVAVDGGGSKIAIAAQRVPRATSTDLPLPASLEGVRVWRFEGSGSAHPSNWTSSQQRLHQSLCEAIRQLATANGTRVAVLLALAGAGREEDRQRVVESLVSLSQTFPEHHFDLHCVGDIDPLVDFYGSSEAAGTVAVILGTGSIVAARAAEGRLIRAGGWGPVLGDECSGAAIGLDALRAVTQSIDSDAELDQPGSLVNEIVKQLKADRPSMPLANRLIDISTDRTTCARLSLIVVNEAFENGEPRALAILDRHVATIAWQIAQVSRRAFGDRGANRILFSGGLADRSPQLRQAVVDKCHSAHDLVAETGMTEPLVAALRSAIRRCAA